MRTGRNAQRSGTMHTPPHIARGCTVVLLVVLLGELPEVLLAVSLAGLLAVLFAVLLAVLSVVSPAVLLAVLR